MSYQWRTATRNFNLSLRILTKLLCAAIFAVTIWAQAQTLTVLYTLNGTTDGAGLISGLVADRQGNLYGAAGGGGINNCDGSGCGTIFKLSRHGSGWIFSVLYRFTSCSDGCGPDAPLGIAPDGSLYGTTYYGGTSGCLYGLGCGTVFKLSPPPSICPTVSCEWTKTTLYEFTGQVDGEYPLGQITFDQAGNAYGTASNSLLDQYDGSVFELSPSGGGWTFNLLYAFPAPPAAGYPDGGVVFDSQGNLWGVNGYGGADDCSSDDYNCGSIFKLSPSSSGWTATNVFQFNTGTGGHPIGTLVSDQSGNFYDTLDTNGPYGGGSVFQFVPSSGQLNVLYAFTGYPGDNSGPYGGVVRDQAGNLYAAAEGGFESGWVFELSPSSGHWIYTDLHNFRDGSDGATPIGPLALDAEGNVYGVDLSNVIFEITP
jgi:uncharacterized repeat protein (TIGR03803 family)